ncbi:MAG: restriction endonuclease subunit S, partial [Muribaculaceae bacterium]|nr:restriction endonuclease subunit S [Muribaculaceae bacterium]
VKICVPNTEIQNHIVDTIGSVDDLIENIDEKLNKIKGYGSLIFSKNQCTEFIPLLSKIKFEKGKELGSANYLERQEKGSIPYIRVGNLLNCEFDSFVFNRECPNCNVDDILIAFDGAPGRNNIGLNGCYSSGIQKVICDNAIKGYIYFYLNSELCQSIIKTYSQGTTILHASRAIKELKLPLPQDTDIIESLQKLFVEMVSIIKQKQKLKTVKDLLLKKYFG